MTARQITILLNSEEKNMFEILLTCKTEELQQNAERISKSLESENVEEFIHTLKKRVPELTVIQEKKLHKLGRKILKQFNMKPIRE